MEWIQKTIVKVIFATDPDTGELDHLAPFLVSDRAGLRAGVYEDEPHVVCEVEGHTAVAYFDAQWIDGHWMFGHRVEDQDW